MEFTGYPDYKFSDEAEPGGAAGARMLAAVDAAPAGAADG